MKRIPDDWLNQQVKFDKAMRRFKIALIVWAIVAVVTIPLDIYFAMH